jgi:hypothetical protein
MHSILVIDESLARWTLIIGEELLRENNYTGQLKVRVRYFPKGKDKPIVMGLNEVYQLPIAEREDNGQLKSEDMYLETHYRWFPTEETMSGS